MTSKRWIACLLIALGPFACSTKSTPSNAAAGVVPADLRDVERDGEGLVSTTFGAYDTTAAKSRQPDWTRTASVLSLLKHVWTSSKTANPGLPTVQVKMIDDAITQLDKAIIAKDQESAALASNAVGLAVPELFDYFHPDAPIEIVRMDAVFRQVGIDAHFGKLDAAANDVSSLKTDWSASKAAVEKRVPTCHRVANTANVVGDIEQSLGNLTTAIANADATTFEVESDNGALEIDTLELLFDCPPDGLAPDVGLGAACSSTKACASGLTCDTAWNKCAPDPSNQIGTPCANTSDCGTDSRSACQTAAGDQYPGGYCFMEPCNDVSVCPPGATCVALGGESPGCFKSCVSDADCRGSENYVCQLFLTTTTKGLWSDRQSLRVCVHPRC